VNPQGTGLDYCGYIGGNGKDWAYSLKVDATGAAYIAGETESFESTFPVKVGPDLTYNGSPLMPYTDVWVAKVAPGGTGLIYCGYIGGWFGDLCHCSQALAIDEKGCAYVTGWTYSDAATFPVNNGPDVKYGGQGDAFIAKVAASGQYLEYCGYIGGSEFDWASAVAVDKAGNAHVTGATLSTETSQIPFPVHVGPDGTANGLGDAFVAKVDAKGTGFLYSGFIGGAMGESGDSIAIDALGRAHVVGITDSDEQSFPVKGTLDQTFNSQQGKGHGDGFVAVVDAAGTNLIQCGYLGGALYEAIYGIAFDPCGNAYVTGVTQSNETSFPVLVGPDVTYNDGPSAACDAFVAKIAHTDLFASGSSSIGRSLALNLRSSNDAGLPYQVGSSLGNGPIQIDTRQIGLSPDGLLHVSVTGTWPGVFVGYQGVIDSQGQAQAAIQIPSIPALIGVRLHTAFVTLDPKAPSGIRSISNTETFQITK
jgi:hypothetical protein